MKFVGNSFKGNYIDQLFELVKKSEKAKMELITDKQLLLDLFFETTGVITNDINEDKNKQLYKVTIASKCFYSQSHELNMVLYKSIDTYTPLCIYFTNYSEYDGEEIYYIDFYSMSRATLLLDYLYQLKNYHVYEDNNFAKDEDCIDLDGWEMEI